MKYIKLYEEFSEDKLYKRVTPDAWKDDLFYRRLVPLDNNDIQILQKYGEIKSDLLLLYDDTKITGSSLPITIHKDNDEYFYCLLSVQYYKCDSIDGVINLIDDINRCRFNELPAYVENHQEYLKLDENYSEKLYKRIEIQEYNKTYNNGTYYINQLEKDKLGENGIRFILRPHLEGMRKLVGASNIIEDNYIFKSDDEYFYCCFYFKPRNDCFYFKCDSIDGLIDLLDRINKHSDLQLFPAKIINYL